MDRIQALLHHIRQKQMLLCAYESGSAAPAAPSDFQTLADITSSLQLGSGECLMLARRLQDRGLIEPLPGHTPPRVRLTERGRRLVQRMTREPARG